MPATTTATPRQRRHEARHRQLLDAAGHIAEDEGWPAVTTRRLAQTIGYSQPVVYQHFATRDDIVQAVVLEGFTALTAVIERVTADSRHDDALADLCRAYLDFATTRPRLYEAMFSSPTSLPFDQSETPDELRGAFHALAQVVGQQVPETSVESSSELFWACCHGLATLLTAGRIPPDRIDQHVHRVAELMRSD